MGSRFLFIASLFFIVSCVTTIPLQSNLSDQVMLMANNKNIQAVVTLTSDVPNGPINSVYIMRNGSQTTSQAGEYQSETAFKNIWNSYFDSKFNRFSSETMIVSVRLVDLYLKQTSATSLGVEILTGNAKSTVEAISKIFVEVEYRGQTFANEFDVTASDYRETQSTQYGTFANTNPTQQISLLLQSTLNRSVIQFDNFIASILNSM